MHLVPVAAVAVGRADRLHICLMAVFGRTGSRVSVNQEHAQRLSEPVSKEE